MNAFKDFSLNKNFAENVVGGRRTRGIVKISVDQPDVLDYVFVELTPAEKRIKERQLARRS